MNICFFTVFKSDPQPLLHATMLVQEAREVMPGVPIVQFTDLKTPQVRGTDKVRRLEPGDILERRLDHYAVCPPESLLIDTDVSIRADVRSVFDDAAFDVALCDRNWPYLADESARFAHTMPFNSGVVFTRNPLFWQHVRMLWSAREDKTWHSEQKAVFDAVKSGKWRVKVLPGQVYNYPPQSPDDSCDHAALVHYKGPRKAWLTQRCYRLLKAKASEPACV